MSARVLEFKPRRELEQVVDIAWLEANDVPTLGLTAAARQKAIGRLSAK